jgi:hypothetical protein
MVYHPGGKTSTKIGCGLPYLASQGWLSCSSGHCGDRDFGLTKSLSNILDKDKGKYAAAFRNAISNFYNEID